MANGLVDTRAGVQRLQYRHRLKKVTTLYLIALTRSWNAASTLVLCLALVSMYSICKRDEAMLISYFKSNMFAFNQPINQSINQSVSLSVSQSVSQQSINQSINQSVNSEQASRQASRQAGNLNASRQGNANGWPCLWGNCKEAKCMFSQKVLRYCYWKPPCVSWHLCLPF